MEVIEFLFMFALGCVGAILIRFGVDLWRMPQWVYDHPRLWHYYDV